MNCVLKDEVCSLGLMKKSNPGGATAETNKRRPERPWRCQCLSFSGNQRFDIQGQTEGRVCTLREGT